MQEGARIQGIQIAEGGRTQALDAAGRKFVFDTQEERELQQLDRVSAQLSGAEARQMQASSDRTGAFTGMISGLGSIASAAASNENFGFPS